MATGADMNLYDATNLVELVELLKAEHGDSDETLASKIGIGATTVHRIRQGSKVDDVTLDKIAAYKQLPRDWIYELAKGIKAEGKYSRIVTMIAESLEQADPDIQEMFFVQVRAVMENRKKSNAKTG